MALDQKQAPFLEAKDVYLEYPFPAYAEPGQSNVGGRIIKRGRSNRLVALDGISFRLEAGDSLGLLGHNGSGKTTLLKVLAGIIIPTRGEVLSHGIIGNALSTRIGFRMEATGRRNVMLKAMMNGYTKNQAVDVVADVDDFAELGPFMDAPLHTYSAGMRARLTFGLATAFPCDILILDEWLGAGDRQMQERVQERMSSFVAQSSISVLATHNANLIKQVSKDGLLLRSGVMHFYGAVEKAITELSET